MQNANNLNEYPGTMHPSSVQGIILGYNTQTGMEEEARNISDDDREIVMDSTQMIQQVWWLFDPVHS